MSPAPRQLIVVDASRLADVAAQWCAAAIETDVREHGSCSVALAGGHTPQPVYERLAREALASRIAWQKVDIFFGDERAVPPDDPASNYGAAAAALLRRVPIPEARVHRMEAERVDRDAAARAYERIFPARLDLLLLGLGSDGHTLSLFPGSGALNERERRIVPVTGPTPPRERLTATPPVIAAARRVAVVVAGAAKAAIASRVLEGPLQPRELPAQLALDGTWFLDREAGARLGSAA